MNASPYAPQSAGDKARRVGRKVPDSNSDRSTCALPPAYKVVNPLQLGAYLLKLFYIVQETRPIVIEAVELVVQLQNRGTREFQALQCAKFIQGNQRGLSGFLLQRATSQFQ